MRGAAMDLWPIGKARSRLRPDRRQAALIAVQNSCSCNERQRSGLFPWRSNFGNAKAGRRRSRRTYADARSSCSLVEDDPRFGGFCGTFRYVAIAFQKHLSAEQIALN